MLVFSIIVSLYWKKLEGSWITTGLCYFRSQLESGFLLFMKNTLLWFGLWNITGCSPTIKVWSHDLKWHLLSSLERGRLWLVCLMKLEHGSIPEPFQSFPIAENSPNGLPQLDKPTLKTTQKNLSEQDWQSTRSQLNAVYICNKLQTMDLHTYEENRKNKTWLKFKWYIL